MVIIAMGNLKLITKLGPRQHADIIMAGKVRFGSVLKKNTMAKYTAIAEYKDSISKSMTFHISFFNCID